MAFTFTATEQLFFSPKHLSQDYSLLQVALNLFDWVHVKQLSKEVGKLIFLVLIKASPG